MLKSMGSQRVNTTEWLNKIDLKNKVLKVKNLKVNALKI